MDSQGTSAAVDSQVTSKLFCVTYGDHKKVIRVENISLADIKNKIRDKFGVVGSFKILAKMEEFNTFVDIDEEDDCDYLLEAKHILVQTSQSTGEGLPSSPSLPDTIILDSSMEDDHASVTSAASSSQSSLGEDTINKSESGGTSSKNKFHETDEFDARAVVRDHPHGKRIEDQYSRNKTLTPEMRVLLVKIIVSHLVQKFGFYPSAEQKAMAAKAIVKSYPTLKDANSKLGYEHFFSSEGGHSGYIQEKLKNIRRSIPSSSKKRPRQTSLTKKEQEEVVKKKKLPYDCLPDSTAEELSLFCRRSSSDRKREIVDAMKRTHPNRQKWIHDQNPSVTEVLRRYPRFKDMSDLIDEEFHLMFGDANNKMISTWDTRFAPGILQLARISKVTKIQELVAELECQAGGDCDDLGDDEPSNDKMSWYAFLILITMLPSHVTKGARKQRCSSLELMDNFIEFKPVGTSVEAYLQSKDDRKNQVQPYLLCLGSRKVPEQFFAVMDKEVISCQDNPVSAVDRLFKVHYVFNLHYAKPLELFYEFLENFVYCIQGKGSVVSTKVAEVQRSILAIQ